MTSLRAKCRHRARGRQLRWPQTRPSGPGSLDQSRPSASQTCRTERGSRLWLAPTRGSSACTADRHSPMTFSALFGLRIEAASMFGQPLSERCVFHPSPSDLCPNDAANIAQIQKRPLPISQGATADRIKTGQHPMALGQKWTWRALIAMSALTPKADHQISSQITQAIKLKTAKVATIPR